MSQLLFILPIISIIIGITLLYKGTTSFMKKGENGYIYFRFLFSLIVLFLLFVGLMGLIIWSQTKSMNIIDNMVILSNIIIVGFPVLGTSIGIGIFGKYLFDFILFIIKYGNKLNNTLRYLKMFLFTLLAVVLLFIIHLGVIYGLIIYFQMTNSLIIIPSNLYLTNSLLLGLSGFGYSIGVSLLISGIFIYLKRLLSKENIRVSKKILYSIGSFLSFIVLYFIIQLGSLFSLIVAFKLLNIVDYITLGNLNIGIVLGIVSLITGVIQGYYFLSYQKHNISIFIPISVSVLTNVSLVLALVYAFHIISSI